MYKINIVLDDVVVNSYKSPVIPRYQEKIYLLNRTFMVKRLGHLVVTRDGQNVLAELDVYVQELTF